MTDFLSELSTALSERVAAAAPLVVGIATGGRSPLAGILWRPDVIVTSEQALPDEQSYTVQLPGGAAAPARPAGRDPGTNVALLRLEGAAAATQPVGAEPRVGGLVLALGAGPSARLALVQAVGPAWTSMAGGQIDALIRLDLVASRVEEGGPVIDAAGGVIGMATAGPRRRALVIPHATIARCIDPLLTEGRVRRGWLGVGLQPVSVPESLRSVAGQDAGLMVVSLAPQGPAEQAGILPGDIILTVAGERTTRPRALRSILGAVGREVEIRLLRAGAPQTLNVTIAPRPA
jgi:S1-C subfamily serine protease